METPTQRPTNNLIENDENEAGEPGFVFTQYDRGANPPPNDQTSTLEEQPQIDNPGPKN